jgi:hypothetical protein
MQKAIYFVSKPIAARGMLELTDRSLNFQVFPFDASFGIKSVSIDVCAIQDVRIERTDLHPRVIVTAAKKYEFVLSKGQELYELLVEVKRNPLGQRVDGETSREIHCRCGKCASDSYSFCPWCGEKLDRS